jgi:hypothetical protein
MKIEFDAILITSDEPYSDTWHTQLIYTEFLSKHKKVIFINPPTKWKIFNLLRFKSKQLELGNQLIIHHYYNFFPTFIPPLNSFNELLNQLLIKKKLKRTNVTSLLIWHFDSFRSTFNSNYFKKAFQIKRIYHVIDPFMDNPENRLLSTLANSIVITSPKNNKYYEEYKEKILNIPQVIDLDLNRDYTNAKISDDFHLPEKYIVFVGTISEDVEIQWLQNCVDKLGINLVMIGKTVKFTTRETSFKTLISHPNVQYLGEMPPSKFYPILKKAKAGIVVYDNRRKNQASSPLKVINYLVAGIPTITNIDSEIKALEGSCIHYVHNMQEFNLTISEAINNKMQFNSSLSESYLKAISLEDSVNAILSKI